MFSLRKISIAEGKSSMVQPGDSVRLPDMTLFKYDSEDKIQDADLKDVDVGWQVILHRAASFDGRYLRTSKIAKILFRTKDAVQFETQSSIYELRKEDV